MILIQLEVRLLISISLPGAVVWLVSMPLGIQAAPRLNPTSGTFFCKDLVLIIFLWPFILIH